MEYVKLGASGLKVSPLCLGTMMFGDRTDATEAGRIVAAARDAGVNFIDTADVYSKGESERITGKLIAPDRDRWVLATKVANAMGDDPNRRGTGRKWVMRAIEESLARLATGGHARRPQRQAHPRDGVPRRVARDRAEGEGARREARHDGGGFRDLLGARQPDRHERHRRAAHPRAVDLVHRLDGKEARR